MGYREGITEGGRTLPKRASILGIGNLRLKDTSGVSFGELLVHWLVFLTV
uniref:Uncharacterized protein n=1 Tax=Triticum urartu TaxID=4572 RepID=A0A8R7Q0G8_TRIUA